MKQLFFILTFCWNPGDGFAQTAIPNAGFEQVSDTNGMAVGWNAEGGLDTGLNNPFLSLHPVCIATITIPILLLTLGFPLWKVLMRVVREW